MNARSYLFELSLEGRQVEEVVACVFHTLLFHRTLGKFHYKQEGSYSVGAIGMVDVDCDFIDVTYVRVASDQLDRAIKKEIDGFNSLLRSNERIASGQISLEFYQKKRAHWPFAAECIPWEVWTIKTELLSLSNEHERQLCREKTVEVLQEKILYIAELMNRHEFVPKLPTESDIDLVFDTSYPDIQPYLFKIAYSTSTPGATVGTSMRKFFKDTLAL